ncbi:MAG: apolipoprotein N-acyltransferase [Gammaproteobacteria bacterium]|nr:apolipoprotein N-acyltransferase [Gammaproteobacteria bacterium]
MSVGDVFSPLLQTGRWPARLSSLLAGALMTLAYQPFGLSLLVFPLFALLLFHWLRSDARGVFIHVWLFTTGAVFTGNSWIFFSLYYHGGSPAILAVTIIVLLAMFLALFHAITAYLFSRFCHCGDLTRLLIVFPSAWLLAEWLRGYIWTGYAWMQPGYTQLDLPLSGYAPVIGTHAIGALIVFTAGVLVAVLLKKLSWPKALFVVALVWTVGFVLKQVSWTQPAGEEIEVALIQGNIPQELKWKRHMHRPTLQMYQELTLENSDADLVIWPETAIPDYKHRVPAYLVNMREAMEKSNTDLLIGLFIRNLDSGRYYNSVISARGGEYRKRHLVPLGEYVPFRSLIGFFTRWINIPMSDIDSGPDDQPFIEVAGQPVGISICFEDAFSRDVRRDLPEATLLVNMSNDAWFDGSHQSRQHHAIARMRALETGRYMMRATNTGISSVIGPRGEELAMATASEREVLRAGVLPMSGRTPYVFWGDAFILILALVVVGVACFRSRPVQ